MRVRPAVKRDGLRPDLQLKLDLRLVRYHIDGVGLSPLHLEHPEFGLLVVEKGTSLQKLDAEVGLRYIGQFGRIFSRGRATPFLMTIFVASGHRQHQRRQRDHSFHSPGAMDHNFPLSKAILCHLNSPLENMMTLLPPWSLPSATRSTDRFSTTEAFSTR